MEMSTFTAIMWTVSAIMWAAAICLWLRIDLRNKKLLTSYYGFLVMLIMSTVFAVLNFVR